MKVSQNWLKTLVDIDSTPSDLSEKLSIGGFEVESLEEPLVSPSAFVCARDASSFNFSSRPPNKTSWSVFPVLFFASSILVRPLFQ